MRACLPNVMSFRSSPRKRVEMSWCSARAVRFIGTQRPSCTIDHEVSTHSATAARVRCSVSTISTSVTSNSRSSPPACRSCALSRVRGTLHASVSPNAHGRVVPRGVARGPRAVGLALAAAGPELVDDVAQRRLPQTPQRLGRQRERPVGSPLEQALALQLALQLGQGAGVDAGLVTEVAFEGIEVDVLQPRPRVALGQLLGERIELAELLHGPGGLAHAHRVVAAEPAAALPVLARAQALQLRVHAGQRLGEPRVAEGLLRQLHQLVALGLAHRVEHPLGGGGPAGEQVDQLLGVLRVLGEELAVLGHELVELRGGVLARGVVGEQVVEVVEHLPDPLDVLGRRVLHRLLHALEPLVEHLAAEQVADLLVGLARVGGPPVVLGELPHGPAGVGGQGVELHLAEPGVVAVVAGERVALGLDRLAEQLADLLQGAVEPVVALQARPASPDLPRQVVEPAPLADAAPQQLLQRRARRGALHDVAADLIQRCAEVDRRGERIGPVGVGAVGVPASASLHVSTLRR